MKVNKRRLYLPAGIMWSGVGCYLIYLAYGWLMPLSVGRAILLAAAGVLLALAIYRFGFSKLAGKNIKRIETLKERVCILAFENRSVFASLASCIFLALFTLFLISKEASPVVLAASSLYSTFGTSI